MRGKGSLIDARLKGQRTIMRFSANSPYASLRLALRLLPRKQAEIQDLQCSRMAANRAWTYNIWTSIPQEPTTQLTIGLTPCTSSLQSRLTCSKINSILASSDPSTRPTSIPCNGPNKTRILTTLLSQANKSQSTKRSSLTRIRSW